MTLRLHNSYSYRTVTTLLPDVGVSIVVPSLNVIELFNEESTMVASGEAD